MYTIQRIVKTVTFKVANVEFNLPTGPVGVLASGGADSSIVLYLLMKYSDQPIHILTLSNAKKNYTNSFIVPKIINWCIEKTGNNNIVYHNWFTEEQTQHSLSTMPAKLLSNKTIKTLYIGDTCYPADEINHTFAANGYDVFQNMKDRDPNTIRPTSIACFYYPFTNHNKKKIAQVYIEENVMELFDLTRSCESFDLINTEHCGRCWWCQERFWAFEKL